MGESVHTADDKATPELLGSTGETTPGSGNRQKPSVHIQPRSRPPNKETLQSLEGYSEYSEDSIDELVEQLKFTMSNDFQVSVNKVFQGNKGSSKQILIESLVRANNPGISDTKLQDIISKNNFEVELLPSDHTKKEIGRGPVIQISFESPLPVTLGDILGESQDKELLETGSPYVDEEKLVFDTTDSGNSDTDAILSTLMSPVFKGPFLYEPLKSTEPEIRLLRLAKPPGPDGLHLSLTPYPLNKAPSFMAVSYCWGDANQRLEITCNKQTLNITTSLDYALKRIFNWRPDLVLWADGICINQEDLSERAAQVKLMGAIYGKAQSTTAYLGEALAPDAKVNRAPDTDQAGFALMLQLNAIWGEEEAPEHRTHQIRPESDWTQMQIPDSQTIDGLRVWIPLLHLCSQPWFSRSWVLQEVALAKNVIVFYGSAVNGLETLTRFWGLATRHDPPMALKHGLVADWKDGIVNWNQLNVFGELKNRKEGSETGKNLIHQPGNLGFVLAGRRRISHSLLELLVKNRSADATDDRDKVYSLLSLADDTECMDIEPNYSSSNLATKLYQDIATFYVKAGRGIDVLHHAGLPQRLNNVPSWVPDWSTKSRQPLRLSQYRCARDTVSHLQLLSDACLRVRGAFVDAAHVLLHKLDLQRLNLVRDLESLRETHNKMWRLEKDALLPPLPFEPDRERAFGAIVAHAEQMALMLLSSYPTRESTRSAVWRTLAAGRGWLRPDDPDGERLAHEAWCKSRPDPFDNAWWPPRGLDAATRSAVWPFQTAVLNASQGYRFGTTACGYMGLFPKECEAGDLIAIIPGASTPFVMRPGQAGAPLTLVGDCYIHGMMRGELLKPSHHGDVQDTHRTDVRYHIRQRAWNGASTETVKQPLRQYFNPDTSKSAPLRDIDIR